MSNKLIVSSAVLLHSCLTKKDKLINLIMPKNYIIN